MQGVGWYPRYRHLPQKMPKGLMLAGFLMGLGGQLYLHLPAFGVIPMLDIAAYAIAIPLLVFLLPQMGASAKVSMGWGLAWAISAWFANTVNGFDGRMILKMFVVCSSSWCIFLVAWYFLKKDARVYLYYLIGVGVGGAIGIHYFQNGAYLAYVLKTGHSATEVLAEKQIYPAYAKAAFLGGILSLVLLFKKFLKIIVFCSAIAAGFLLLFHGGSRSNFGFYLVTAVAGYAIATAPRFCQKFLKNTILLVTSGIIGATVLFASYTYLAKSGRLGEGELDKYENEEDYGAENSEGRMTTRSGINETWKVVQKKPWGEGGNLRRHSVISNSWNCEGYVGLFFWLYFYWQVFWFLRKRMAYTGRFAAFISFQLISACWAVAGSPFGSRHHFFVLMALIALSKDNPHYGENQLFFDLNRK